MDIIIVVASLLGLALITVNPKIGVYLIAASLPVIGRDVYIYGLIIPIADLAALLTLLGFLINLIARSFFAPQVKIKISWPLFFPFFLFLLASIISVFLSNHVTDSLYYFLRWPVFLYFAYIFVPANIIQDTKVLKRAVILVFLSSMAVLVSGYLSLMSQDWQDAFFRMKSLYFLKSYPFGENHNLIAEFLNIGAFFVLLIKEFLKDARAKRLADILFLVTALGIILTFSRTGWIILFLQSSVYLFYRLHHNNRDKMAIVIVVLLMIGFLSPLFWKMSVLQDSNTSSTENRLLLTEIAREAFNERPIFGYGSGEFVSLVNDNIRFRAKYGPPVDSHGVLQKVAAENGIFGLLSWLFLFVYLVRFSVLAIKKYYPRIKWVLPFALASLGGLFFQLFNTSYYKGKVWFPIILFILAVKFSDERYAKKHKNIAHPAKLS